MSERIDAVAKRLTEITVALTDAVEAAAQDGLDAVSVVALADRLRQLQAEQNALIAELLGLVMLAADSEP